MFRLQRFRFGIARFLFSLYLAVLVNGVVFRHAHRLADGTIICHAHPYKSSPGTQFPNHNHSSDELIWLDAFTNALYDGSELAIWTALVSISLLLTSRPIVSFPAFFSFQHFAYRHRGPPVHLA
ncbi:hypothetical protein HNV11_01095 [Spirosoma taeanense]|uniref:Uncharacterized protein n=1 Tax=Spirosoma taeanense TaxID=2735870 RepID=A0A6M5Y3W5_9BACT|nr:hypothetical protein [Spirosoma taeanense]QJW88066.1 hypothetical protein HNV11_01095 [Spirosoma taeanense]